MTTSLQKAAENGGSIGHGTTKLLSTTQYAPTTYANRSSQPSNRNRNGGGIFEASFDGLDLSEFRNATAPQTTAATSIDTAVILKAASNRESASSQLLRSKRQEMERAEEEEREEALISEQACLLAKEREEKLERERAILAESGGVNISSGGASTDLYSALVSMHSGDVNGAKIERLSKSRRRKSTMVKSAKKRPMKKVKRSKFRVKK
eukprot:CAMPEP_0198251062 /NCGR_PEP_ID=MMETSP1447-20131203/2027_1 /TAXON_ID=420782 /ORGANISM="Chaetoceros dichaeta, Strain CCMP1751" /LENGTH=207 /DNA_ID=CAMNT_0043936005 /DNA_START=17 /DNA_END=640 /DNA_ORIENTATION=-